MEIINSSTEKHQQILSIMLNIYNTGADNLTEEQYCSLYFFDEDESEYYLSITGDMPLDDRFISLFYEWLDMEYICREYKLSEEMIRHMSGKIHWGNLFRYQSLSLDFAKFLLLDIGNNNMTYQDYDLTGVDITNFYKNENVDESVKNEIKKLRVNKMIDTLKKEAIELYPNDTVDKLVEDIKYSIHEVEWADTHHNSRLDGWEIFPNDDERKQIDSFRTRVMEKVRERLGSLMKDVIDDVMNDDK